MIPLGYEVGTGKRVNVPLKHLAVVGQTQESGKTTTLEALITRSGLRAIAFVTKRGEKSFRKVQPIPAYFSEATNMEYWKFVAALVESMASIKLGFNERGWLIKLCDDYNRKEKNKERSHAWKKPSNLVELLRNVESALPHMRGNNELVLLQLRELLKSIVPEVAAAKFSGELKLADSGIHVMDVSRFSVSLQSLVIRSVLEWVYQHGNKTVVIIPEAWQFIPQGRNTPVKLAAEELIRKGGALQNFVWIDSQDLRGVDKNLLRSVQVWLFGVQREKNEIANTLDSIPDFPRPNATDVMRLQKGQFFVAFGNVCVKAYVQPAGMEDEQAISIAIGETDTGVWKEIEKDLDLTERTKRAVAREREPEPEEHVPGTAQLSTWKCPYKNKTCGTGGVVCARCDEDFAAMAETENDEMWKEKYEELQKDFDALQRRMDLLQKDEVKAEDARTFSGEPPPINYRERVAESADQAARIPMPLDMVYDFVKERAQKDPAMLAILDAQRPQMDIKITRPTVEMDKSTLLGQVAALIPEKFFDSPKNGPAVAKEIERRYSNKQPTTNVYKPLNRLTEYGFLTNEADGFLAVKSMKVNLVEA